MDDFADANPAKRFFIEMLTRDIRLEDAVLDLIDNAIDSIIRLQQINLSELVTNLGDQPNDADISHWVKIDIRDGLFEVTDNCGGIDYDDAKEYVFRFGSDEKPRDSRLSVYGIGLKRAIFKIGRFIVIESRTKKNGFRINIDVDKWEKNTKDWRFPLERIDAARNEKETGTKIKITKIVPSAMQRLNSGSFKDRLVSAIGESYSLFLDQFVNVFLDGDKIESHTIPISNSDDAVTSISKDKFQGVDVIILAGLQKLEDGNWRGNTAGWYIICNGRVVVFGDTTELTGWGARVLPSFQPKHRGFIGIALFLSDDPEALPWTTTKRGINAEAPVFQYVRERMALDAREVIKYLDQRYSSVPVSSENTDDLEVTDVTLKEALKPVRLPQLFSDVPRQFSAPKESAKRESYVSVQYRAKASDITRARRAIGKPKMAAGRVGLHALEYFLENESDE